MRERMEEVRKKVSETGRDVYFAGLGMAAIANDRAQRVFDGLVEKGKEKGQSETTEKPAKATNLARDAYARTMDKVQQGFGSTLRRLGIPTRQEISELSQSIEQLTEKVQNLHAKKA